ncbi:hypothetical protein [Nocardia rhizosphaerae]|uniref:Uncharacterized protein n=1 Tax=Nocardia rhizosphaerae TaxID=1691571 RepID=A0ABV8L3T1_9NOCA
MALATQEDVEDVLGRDLTSDEESRVDGQLEAASDLVVGHLYPCPIPDPVPGAITRVTAEMVADLITRKAAPVPEGATSLGAGVYNVGLDVGATTNGPWLTAKLKTRLLPYRCGNGMASVALTSDRYIT